jgi:small subunit ribosomal protein S9
LALVSYYGTGKRKTAIARVYIRPGDGKMTINKRESLEYFKSNDILKYILKPLELTKSQNVFDILVKVLGGGINSQADAVRHGLSKALLKYDDGFHLILKQAGFLTRDSRKKERKKYGQKGARARFQFSKR